MPNYCFPNVVFFLFLLVRYNYCKLKKAKINDKINLKAYLLSI